MHPRRSGITTVELTGVLLWLAVLLTLARHFGWLAALGWLAGTFLLLGALSLLPTPKLPPSRPPGNDPGQGRIIWPPPKKRRAPHLRAEIF